MELREIIHAGGFACECGRYHRADLEDIIIESGALRHIPDLVRRYGGTRVFILSDVNCMREAGDRVCAILDNAGIPHASYVFPQAHVEPDEAAVGAAVMHFDPSCDLILGVGSGVINDIGKILARLSGKTYFIAGTAPSMDGYASATSSMARDGLKVSIDSVCPAVIIADLDIISQAPMVMLQSGLGDMAAKYISICEWRIAHELLGEPFCPVIAGMVKDALARCAANAEGMARREPEAVAAVMEGLVLTGIAMSYAGLSRPASGMEHYISHIWDMRGLEFGCHADTHGIQCGVAALLCLRVYDYIRQIIPDRQKALDYVASFDPEAWNGELVRILGKGAQAMIEGERKEKKYDPVKHAVRLEKILSLWPRLLEIMEEELPSAEKVASVLGALGTPLTPEAIGQTRETTRMAFLASKDIRDKYIGARLLWDLGMLEEAADALF